MTDVHSKSEVIADLAEEFVERYRRGERPAVSEYTDKHPELAEEIREFISALVMVENLAPVSEDAPADSSQAESLKLRQLGDYRIIREVGRGGMGVVYEAEQVSLGRHVALKVLPQHALLDASQKHRFAREARAAARLHHTNIVPVFGVGEEDGLQYYVMQFIQGLGLEAVLEELKSLQNGSPVKTPPSDVELPVSQRRDVSAGDVARSLVAGEFQHTILTNTPDDEADLAMDVTASPRSTPADDHASLHDTDHGRLSVTDVAGAISLPGQSSDVSSGSHAKPLTYWQSVASIGVQVASALQYAHDQGIQHRDIKPSNLLLDLRGTVWVADFGLAKSDDQQNITHTGDILGTLRYMPPEAFAGGADHRGDIYSLGLTLYEMLAMRPAFDESDRNRLIRQVSQEAPPRLDKLNPEVPRDLVTIVHKAIDRDASHRYQNAGELAEDLQRFINDEPIKARRISPVERFVRWSRRNKALSSLTATIAVLLVVVSVASFVFAGEYKRIADDKEIARQKERAARQEESAALGRETKAHKAALVAFASEKAAKDKAVEQRDLAEALEKKAVEAKEELAYREYVAGMHFARNLWEAGKISNLKRLLAGYIPTPGSDEKDLRQFEWYHWWRAVHLHKDRVYVGGPASRVAMIPDRNLLIIPHYQNQISVVDMKDPQARPKTFDALQWWDNPPQVSKDGRFLFHFGRKGRKLVVVRYDTRTWTAIPNGTIELPNNVAAFAVSPTGRHIAVAEQHKQGRFNFSCTIHILTMDGKPVAKLSQLKLTPSPYLKDHPAGFDPGLGGTVNDMAFSPDGNTLLVGYDRGMARARGFLKDPSKLDWMLVEGPTTSVWGVLWQRQAVAAIAYSADGKQLATCGFDGVRLWDPDTLQPAEPVHLLRTLSPVTSVRFSPNGNRLAACGSRDQAAYVWSIKNKRNSLFYGQFGPAIVRGHARRVVDVAFPSNDEIWTIGNDGNARIWDLNRCRRVDTRRIAAVSDKADLYFHPTRRALIFTFEAAHLVDGQWKSGGALLVSLDNIQKGLHWIKGGKPQGTRVVNGKWMVAWTPQDKKLRVWNLAADEVVGTWDVEDIEEKKLTISRDGKTVAWGHSARRLGKGRFAPPEITVLSVSPGSKPQSIKFWTERGFVGWMRLSPDGKRLAVRGFSATDLFDLSEEFPRRIRRLRDQGPDTCGEFSPDGKLLAIGSWISDIRIHDGRTGEPLRSLRGHSGLVRCLAFSADGKTLVSGGTDGTVRVWDPWRGELRTTLSQDADSVESVAISPDGRTVASHGSDHQLRLWRGSADTDDELSPESIGKYYLRKGNNEFGAMLYGEALRNRRRAVTYLPRKSFERHTALFQQALLEFHFGRVAEYQRICDEIAGEFSDTDSLEIQERTVKLFTFAEVAQSEKVRNVISRFTGIIGDRIDKKGNKSGIPGKLHPAYLFLAQGIAQYRIKNYAAARRLLSDSFEQFGEIRHTERKRPFQVMCRYYLALTAHRAGNRQEAIEQFAKAMGGMTHLDDDDARTKIRENWIMLESAQREAGKVIPKEAIYLGNVHRGNALMHQGRLREAQVDYARAVEKLPVSPKHNEAAMRLGCLLVHFDRIDDYKKLCRKIAEQYSDTNDIQIMERTIKLCLFSDVAQPKAVTDVTAKFSKYITQNYVKEAAGSRQLRLIRVWVYLAQGIAAFRQGELVAAKDWFAKSNARIQGKRNVLVRSVRATNLLFLAMIAHREKRNDDAKSQLAAAITAMESINSVGRVLLLTDWHILQRVRSEAEAMIEGK